MKTAKTKWFVSVSLTKLGLVATAMFLAATSSASATVRYVKVDNTNPSPPYTNLVTAATDIQDAVNVAATNDVVMDTNGTYAGGVTVSKALTLVSVKGPQFSVINSGGAVQCISLTDDASLTGFIRRWPWFRFGTSGHTIRHDIFVRSIRPAAHRG